MATKLPRWQPASGSVRLAMSAFGEPCLEQDVVLLDPLRPGAVQCQCDARLKLGRASVCCGAVHRVWIRLYSQENNRQLAKL